MDAAFEEQPAKSPVPVKIIIPIIIAIILVALTLTYIVNKPQGNYEGCGTFYSYNGAKAELYFEEPYLNETPFYEFFQNETVKEHIEGNNPWFTIYSSKNESNNNFAFGYLDDRQHYHVLGREGVVVHLEDYKSSSPSVISSKILSDMQEKASGAFVNDTADLTLFEELFLSLFTPVYGEPHQVNYYMDYGVVEIDCQA